MKHFVFFFYKVGSLVAPFEQRGHKLQTFTYKDDAICAGLCYVLELIIPRVKLLCNPLCALGVMCGAACINARLTKKAFYDAHRWCVAEGIFHVPCFGFRCYGCMRVLINMRTGS